MRVLLPLAFMLALLLPAADAVAEPTGAVSVLRNGELDGFTQDGKLHRLNSLDAFAKFTGQTARKTVFRRCGFQRAIIEDLKGHSGTDGLSVSVRFKTAAGARSCARKSSLGKGKRVHGLPHSKLVLLGEGDHPGRNLRFVAGRTYYSAAFTPTASFDPGNSGLISAAKLLYGRVV
jgi:hypothetical protein